MKKLFALLVWLGISSCLVAQEIPDPKDVETLKAEVKRNQSWKWFIGAGMGSLTDTDLNNSSFLTNLSGGIFFPHSPRHNSILSLELGIMPINATEQYGSTPITTRFKGYNLDFSINYSLSCALYQSEFYQPVFFVGIGMGARYVNQTISEHLASFNFPSVTESFTAFLMNYHFGFRNIFVKRHALDLTFQHNILRSKGYAHSVLGNVGGISLLISYTFLNF